MKKVIASFFAAIMMFQAISGVLDVVAQEMRKVHLADQTGPYYNKDRSNVGNTNTYTNLPKPKEVLTKEAESPSGTETYDEDLEVVEERTINSKTYEVTPGTYVKEIYFEPVHAEVEGELVDIDNTLENKSKKRNAPVYENKEGYYDVKIENKVLTMSSKEGQSLSFTQEGNVSNYDVKDNVILYSEVYENIDMEYTLGGNAIRTKFHINGPITQDTINYSIDYGDLTVKEDADGFLFLDREENVIFTYQKPMIVEEKDIKHVDITSTKDNGILTITLELPKQWINDSERNFPVSLQSRTAYEPIKINLKTSYNRSDSPDITSKYYDLFVGYEDGSQSGGIPFGIARSYLYLGDLNLGPDKLIEGASLELYKHTSRTEQWKEISISKTSGYRDVYGINWANKPTDLTHVSTTTLEHRPGWHAFDVKSYIQDIYAGKNNVIEMKCTNESKDYIANFFFSESGQALPRVMITYRDAFDVKPDLDINEMDMEMRVYAKKNVGFHGLSFDGIAKPDSQVLFDLVKKDDSTVIKSESSKGNANRYFQSPIFVTNPLPNVQTYTKKDNNYTTDLFLLI